MFSVRDCLTAVVQSLQENGIKVVEYGEILEKRLGCPVVLQVRCLFFYISVSLSPNISILIIFF